MIEQITHIDEVIEWRLQRDLLAHEAFDVARDAHLELFDLWDMTKIVNPISDGTVCPVAGCTEPTATVLNKTTARGALVCRDCINAKVGASLAHWDHTDQVCIYCRWRYDDYGHLFGAGHNLKMLEDTPFPQNDGSICVRIGLINRIARDEVTYDTEADQIIIEPYHLYIPSLPGR